MTNPSDQEPYAFVPEFSEETGMSLRQKISAFAIAGAGVVVAHRAGVSVDSVNGLIDATFVPETPVVTEIVDGMVVVNEGIRTAAPFATASAIGYGVYNKFLAPKNLHNWTVEKMSSKDFSGTEQVAASEKGNRLTRAARAAVKGLGVLTLTALITGGASGLENEISNGPNRPVGTLFAGLSAPGGESHIIVQDREVTFMDDSYVDEAELQKLSETASQEGISVVPIEKQLLRVGKTGSPSESGLVLGLPDEVFSDYSGVEITSDLECDYIPAVVDEVVDVPVGDTIEVNGIRAEAVKEISGTAMMNRNIAILPESAIDNCITGNEGTVYGAIVSGEGATEFLEENEEIVPGHFITQEKFEANNQKFWRKNGTPVILQMMFYVAGMGTAAIFGQRRSKLQSDHREIGTLNATGTQWKAIKRTETMRAVKESAKATLIAAPFMPAMAAVFNAAERGLAMGMSPRMAMVGFLMTVSANIAGTRHAVRKFAKNLKKSESVKG